jgi:hypothetical protein
VIKPKLNPKDKEVWEAEVNFYRTSTRLTRDNRAHDLGFENVESYSNYMRIHGIYLSVPTSHREKFNKPEIIRESCLVIFDTQIPFHDADFLNHIFELAADWGIRQGISGGDLLNMTSFSKFYEKPSEKVWEKERDEAVRVLMTMTDVIPDWLLVKGNHEDFLLKKLEEQIDHEGILALVDNRTGFLKGFKATDYYYCEVRLGGSLWRITHPRNISVIHGRIPQRLCERYHCNIASGHGHLAGMTPDYSGKYLACDVGITCDPLRLDYVSLRDSTRPAQCQGALILQLGDDNKCHPYHLYPDLDWAALKRLY